MPQLDEKGTSNSIRIDQGVFVSLVTIVRIEDQSVHPRWKDDRATLTKKGKEIEIRLQVTYDDNGFERRMWFNGYYKKDRVTGQIRGWNAKRNAAQDFLIELKSKELVEKVGLNEDYSIKPEFLESLVGLKFYRIAYVSGTWGEENKPNYNDHKQIFKEGTNIEDIKETWIEATKWLKDYTPDVVASDNEDTKFNYGANAQKEDDVI